MRKVRFTLPLLPLKGITVFPGMIIHFDVGRPRSIAAVRKALNEDKLIYLCFQPDSNVENPQLDDLSEIGTIGEIHQILNLPDGNVRILVEGIYRGRITKFTENDDYTEVNVSRLGDIYGSDETYTEILTRRAMHLVEKFMEIYDRLSADSMTSLLSIDDPAELADVIASNLPIKPNYKQAILDELNVDARLDKLIETLNSELNILSLEKTIMSKVHNNFDKNQREYMLREKIRVIHEELGDENEVEADIRKYTEKLSDRNLPVEVSEKLNEEFERLRRTHLGSQEYGVIQNYIETVISLPWGIKTEDSFDTKAASEILERDHFGLKEVKERIIEYIAVRSLGGKPKSNIICLVGPPGTGKTSIARSLADALGRKYVRISLGGVRNESEIRGHRKTYVGAMPGRIIDGIKRAGTENPLMLFDEIDKLSSDSIAGDPSSAMLEVFDPEQNANFRDHFVELAFDLSDVICVATANTLDTIPRPLLDRMDVIEVEGYTSEEKIEIAKKYLVPKQRTAHGLSSAVLKFAPSSYPEIINGYTRESGVRELERKIAAVCRKAAVKISEEPSAILSVKKNNIKDFLGNQIYHIDKTNTTDTVGTVTGLAWTSVGGDTLSIEVGVMPGTGKLELTGNLGDVMQESAKAAYSYVRTNAFRLGIKSDFYKDTDIHIHIPEGAVPKDGPSAGVTMVTALTSALTQRKVRHEVAMTGEISLLGKVLPIGGLKEKTLAALRADIKTVVIPFENKQDYEKLPDVVKENISFVFAKTIDTVLDTALMPDTKKNKEIVSNISHYNVNDKTVEHGIYTPNIN